VAVSSRLGGDCRERGASEDHGRRAREARSDIKTDPPAPQGAPSRPTRTGGAAALRLPTDVANFFFAIPVRGERWRSGVRSERS